MVQGARCKGQGARGEGRGGVPRELGGIVATLLFQKGCRIIVFQLAGAARRMSLR